MKNRLMLLAKIGIVFVLLSFANLSFARFYAVDNCFPAYAETCHKYKYHKCKKVHKVKHVKKHVITKKKYIYERRVPACNNCGIPANAPEAACVCSNCDYCSTSW